ncbi:MAG: hypothetical protein ACFFGZ_10325 [Candidatus Thorarchaeota archaeon]
MRESHDAESEKSSASSPPSGSRPKHIDFKNLEDDFNCKIRFIDDFYSHMREALSLYRESQGKEIADLMKKFPSKEWQEYLLKGPEPNKLRSMFLVEIIATFESLIRDLLHVAYNICKEELKTKERWMTGEENIDPVEVEPTANIQTMAELEVETVIREPISRISLYISDKFGIDMTQSKEDVTALIEGFFRRDAMKHGAEWADAQYNNQVEGSIPSDTALHVSHQYITEKIAEIRRFGQYLLSQFNEKFAKKIEFLRRSRRGAGKVKSKPTGNVKILNTKDLDESPC